MSKQITITEYEPFGKEWVDHLTKLPKKHIIDMFRQVCIQRHKLEVEIKAIKEK